MSCPSLASAAAPPADSAPAAKGTAPIAARPSGPVPPLTLAQFEQAVQLATLATERKLPALAFKAIRDALRGGPPTPSGDPGAPQPRRPEGVNAADRLVEARLQELVQKWRGQGFPEAEIYATLVAAVLPEGRPDEVFIYPRPLGEGFASRPRSLGQLLAETAAHTNNLDDLFRRAEARGKQPGGALNAHIMLLQASLAGGNAARPKELLTWLDGQLQKDSLQTSAELAFHAALPALARADLAPTALPLLERAVKTLAQATPDEPTTSLLLLLARHHFEHGHADAGRQRLKDLLALKTDRAGGDTQNYLYQQLPRIAYEYLRAGQLAEGLDVIGMDAELRAARWGLDIYYRYDLVNGLMATFRRALAGRPAQERYALLKTWTLPTAGRPRVRLIGASVYAAAPPSAFGPVAAPPAEVVSTFGLLIEAARELGKLGELAAEVRPLADRKVENAQQLLWLVQIAQGQQTVVQARLQGLRPVLDWPDYLVVRACLEDAGLAERGEALARQLLPEAQTIPKSHRDFLSQLRSDLAASRVARSASGPDLKRHAPGLAHWHQTERARGHAYQTGTVPAWWVAHDGRVAHLGGIGAEYLFYDYPLAGRFTFSVEGYEAAWFESHLCYGGVMFENINIGYRHSGSINLVNLHDVVARRCESLRRDAFNRLTLEVEPGKVRCLVNDQLFYEDVDAGPTSPWLALFTRRESQAVYRNPTLRGTPTVPRAVALSHADRLDGWVCTSYYETMPRRLNPQYRALAQGEYDWVSHDGVIRGRRAVSLTSDPNFFIGNQFQPLQACLRPLAPQPVPSQLAYLRPLRPGENVNYEFFYKPGEVLVHPSVGRVAYLLEPGGVRLHWMTEGLDKDWTGLSVDNAVDVPAERRGPDKLPLKADAWNTVRLKLTEAGIMLELDGTVVYERKLDADADRTFGLFHFKDQTAVQVRNVILTGNWPEAVTPQQLADSFLPVEKADGALRRALIGEEFFR
jgi:hypothetical protein